MDAPNIDTSVPGYKPRVHLHEDIDGIDVSGVAKNVRRMGRDAREDGKTLHDNPFPDGAPARLWWAKGFMDGKHEDDLLGGPHLRNRSEGAMDAHTDRTWPTCPDGEIHRRVWDEHDRGCGDDE